MDTEFRDEIASCILGLKSEKEVILLSDVITSLRSFIVRTYKNEKMADFKEMWIHRVKSVLEMLDVEYVDDKSDWEYIASHIINNLLTTLEQLQGDDSSVSSIVTSNTSSSTSSTTIAASLKQEKLSANDKEAIKKTYDGLQKAKMWRLSSGVLVEEKMKEFAMKCEFEHPSHSLILDVSDPCWKELFTDAEMNEIRANPKPLPSLPEDLHNYLEAMKPLSSIDASLDALTKNFINVMDQPSLEWAQSSAYEYLKLFIFNFFPLNQQTEGDVLTRIWSALVKVFDTSDIDAISGEKASVTSGAARNNDRKVDLLFKCQKLEMGCAECGKVDVHNSTKKLMDGSFKLPKVLKDMFMNFLVKSPSLVRQLSVIGFILMGTKLVLTMLDSPAGYVSRITKYNPLHFPEDIRQFGRRLPVILETLYRARLSMEQNHEKLIDDDTPISLEMSSNDPPIPGCFYAEPKTAGRKRQRDDSTSA